MISLRYGRITLPNRINNHNATKLIIDQTRKNTLPNQNKQFINNQLNNQLIANKIIQYWSSNPLLFIQSKRQSFAVHCYLITHFRCVVLALSINAVSVASATYITSLPTEATDHTVYHQLRHVYNFITNWSNSNRPHCLSSIETRI